MPSNYGVVQYLRVPPRNRTVQSTIPIVTYIYAVFVQILMAGKERGQSQWLYAYSVHCVVSTCSKLLKIGAL